MEDTLVRMQCSYSTTRMMKSTNANGFYISGFASSNTTDRDADAIDPKLFDLDTYRKNPQLWVNHSLWNDGKGNGISVGIVEEVHAVKVTFEEGDKFAKLLNIATDEVVRDDVEVDEFLFKNGETGLWVVCKIEEPDVIKLVESKRLNAFSWSGTSQRKRNGAIKSIDLWEISLVNVPANQKAVFRIGKSLRITDDAYNMVVIDLDAVACLLDAPMDKKVSSLTQDEIKQLAAQTSFVDNKGAGESKNEPKGGESPMTPEDRKSLEEMLGGVTKSMTDAMTGITEKVDGMAKKIEALESKNAGSDDDSDDDDAKVKAPKKKPTPEELAAMEEKVKADKEKEKKSADGGIVESLTSLQTLITDFATKTEKSLTAMDSRIAKMEKTPSSSRAASDDDADNDTEAMQKSLAAVREKLAAMTPAERARLERRGLADVLIPSHVGN